MDAWQFALFIILLIFAACSITAAWFLKTTNKSIMRTLSEMMTPGVYNQRHERQYELVNHWLWLKNSHMRLYKYLEYKGLRTVAIYGAGELGMRLAEELDKDIVYFIDKNPDEVILKKGLVKKVDDLTVNDSVDAIIVTPILHFGAIKNSLSSLPYETEIISLEEMVFKVSDYYMGGEC